MMSHLIEVSVDDLGRILIPSELQSHLGLTPGMILMVEKGDDDGLRLSLQSQPSELVEKGGVLVVRAEPLADLNDITRREREDRVSELIQRGAL
jgi:bifunctional DNA-binding transcriptional regulator/antitoxin component of YhaV-PrlF toxin-antitoxin module